jgi:hypothetical protein
MTARDLITQVESRGIKLRVEGDEVRARGLRKDERDFLRVPSNAEIVAALLELDNHLRADAEQTALTEDTLFRHAERRAAEQSRRQRLDVMATWDVDKVVRMIESGKLTATDVKDWKREYDARQRRAAIRLLAGISGANVVFR